VCSSDLEAGSRCGLTMDIKSRLAQLDQVTRRQRPAQSHERVRRSYDPDVALASLGLCPRETDQGTVWTLEHQDTWELAADICPDAAHFPDMTGLFTREPSARPRLDQLLLMDTETTGLAGGTGTLVFQVGVSWWVEGTLITRQYFLPGPAHEAAMLADLAKLAHNFSTIVTFNGASFDLPLLRTRALLSRQADPFGALTSWDLLVPSRRMWNHCLPNCRQGTIERWICQFERGSGDIDGRFIPQTWFDFLSTGDVGELSNVLTHNHRDMIGMARILDILARVGLWLSEPAPEAVGESWDLPDAGRWDTRAGWWALGKVLERRSEVVRAARCFEQAWSGGWGEVVGDENRIRFRRDAVRNLKRNQNWETVASVIEDGLADGLDCDRLHREAAILYEHRLVDLERAMKHAIACGEENRQSRLARRIDKNCVQIRAAAEKEGEACR